MGQERQKTSADYYAVLVFIDFGLQNKIFRIDIGLESDLRTICRDVGLNSIMPCSLSLGYFRKIMPDHVAAPPRLLLAEISFSVITSMTKNTSYASPDDKPSMTCELRSLARTGNEPFLGTVLVKASLLNDESTRTSAVTVAGGTLADDGTAAKCATPTPARDVHFARQGGS